MTVPPPPSRRRPHIRKAVFSHLGENPTWCWGPGHVHEVLNRIQTHFSDLRSLQPYTVPEPMNTKGDAITRTRRQKRSERKKQLRGCGRNAYSKFEWNEAPGTEFGTADRLLRIHVIRRAIIDYAFGLTSPVPLEQRRSLNAFWWLYGHPVLTTRLVRESQQGIYRVAEGCVHDWGIASGLDPFDGLELMFENLLVPSNPGHYYPPGYPDADNELQAEMSYLRCCFYAGVEPEAGRFLAHYIDPPTDSV